MNIFWKLALGVGVVLFELNAQLGLSPTASDGG